MLALLLHVHILGLFHPHEALVWPDGAAQPVAARPGESYGVETFAVAVPGLARRAYRGRLEVRDGGAELELINVVELEDYVAGTVAAELSGAPRAAREALAVVARSFALRAEAGGHLCDTTHCQWYRGSGDADAQAAAGTRGEVLLSKDGRVAPAFHSQDCGGSTRESWRATERTPDTHPPGLPKGHGHGVGLCQRGAVFLATKGASAHQILARYFPALRLGTR